MQTDGDHPGGDEQTAFYCLATRYLTGEASSDERQQLVVQLKSPANQRQFSSMQQGWEANPANWAEGFHLEEAKQKVAARIAERRANIVSASRHEPAGAARAWAWLQNSRVIALAASIVLVASVTVLSTFTAPQKSPPREDPITWAQQTNSAGAHQLISLNDGTKITLNAGSTLSYPVAFGSQQRLVRLTGEAFFDVAHDKARPFVVETTTVAIRVLGTRFNVRAFEDGTSAQVTVVEGRVNVTPTHSQTNHVNAPIALAPGQRYSFEPDTGAESVHAVAVAEPPGWIQDKIIWDREPLPAAMRELGRLFNLTVELADPELSSLSVTGRFQTESVQDILELLRKTDGVDYCLVPGSDGKTERVILRSTERLAEPSQETR